MRVDHDPVPAFEPRLAGERVLGDDADADQHQIGRQDLAVREHDRLGLVRPLDRLTPTPRASRAPKTRCACGIEVGQDRRHCAAHRPGDLDHGHRGAELGRRRRDLEPDEARADYDDLEARGDPIA